MAQCFPVLREFFIALQKKLVLAMGIRDLPLPDELLEEIFARLPAKTLGRAKLVSKRWRRIISNSGFVLLHARRWTRNTQFLLINMSHPWMDPKSTRRNIVYASLDASTINASTIGTLHSMPDSDMHYDGHLNMLASVVTTCSGLVVFYCKPSFFEEHDILMVGNPTTKSYMTLPSHPFMCSTLYGLAVDVSTASTTSFKLVVLLMGNSGIATFGILSSADRNWRLAKHPLPGLISPYQCFGSSVYCASKLHWMGDRDERVVVFDVARQEASLIDHPAPLKPLQINREMCLGSADGHLRLVALEEGCIRVWALLDYQERGMWILDRQFIMAPCIPPAQKVLMFDGDKFVLLTHGVSHKVYKMVVHRINGTSTSTSTINLEEPSWGDECCSPPRMRYLPYNSTMLKLLR